LQQPFDLARLGMAKGLQLRIEQLIVDREFKSTAVRGDEGERLDLRLEFLEKLGCQTDSSLGVVSNLAVNKLNFYHGGLRSVLQNKSPAGDATGVNKPASRSGTGAEYSA
jgi:hypothetical protein